MYLALLQYGFLLDSSLQHGRRLGGTADAA